MRFRRVIGACLTALVATSCSLGSTADTSSINLYLEVSDSQLTVGQDSMTITVTARNVGYDALTFTGPSDCLLYVDVLTSQGTVVWSSNRSCTGAIVTEELAAGHDKIQSFVWYGSNQQGEPLGPGSYVIRAVARVTGAAYVGPPLTVALD